MVCELCLSKAVLKKKTKQNEDILRFKKLKEFITSRPTLQEMLKDVLQGERK